MAYLPELPQTLVDTPPFGFPQHQHYPFADQNQYSGQDLLYVLRDYIAEDLDVEDHVIRPLDFKKYNIPQLRTQYHNWGGNFQPLYFFHHWGIHPQKRNRDMSQRSMDAVVHRSMWKKFGHVTTYLQENPVAWAPTLVLGRRTRYKLYHSINGGHDGQSGLNLEEYVLHPAFYEYFDDDDAPVTENKLTPWAIVKMWHGFGEAM